MSIQVTTAPGALVALGLGVSDVSTLVALGRRVGNWWTAADGDKEFLSLLDEDASSILQRRGLLDVAAFNKRWSMKIQLLAQGDPIRLEDRDIKHVLKDSKILLRVCLTPFQFECPLLMRQDLSLFTSVMTCLVAVLDQFAKQGLVKDILHNVLKSLLKLHENGEDILRSQYCSRLNAWRSTGVLRDLSQTAYENRQELIRNGSVMSGWFPETESGHVEEFLTWLLGSQEPFFKTSSSDIVGMAIGLFQLGFDTIDVQSAESFEKSQRPCTVIYSAQPFYHSISAPEGVSVIAARDASITVPLEHPEEAVSVFPIGHGTLNQCRIAWKAGQKAAKTIQISVQGKQIPGRRQQENHQSAKDGWAAVGPSSLTAQLQRKDVTYVVTDAGDPAGRASGELYYLALNFGFFANRETVKGLEDCLGRTSTDILSWMLSFTRLDTAEGMLDFSSLEVEDKPKVEAFCIFQSFMMGYYYDIFGRLVDTSSLAAKTVEGSWGFLSPALLRYMRLYSIIRAPSGAQPHVRTFGRSRLIPLLSMLFVGGHGTSYDPELAEDRFMKADCLGIVGKRALIAKSLLGKCSSPQKIGSFALLDVDVGGVPRDFNGLIKAGVLPPDIPLVDCLDVGSEELNISESSPPDDVTFHIEADWEANPETVLLCVRFRGRRLATVSPIPADYQFCNAHLPPVTGRGQSLTRNGLSEGVVVEVSTLLQDSPVLPVSYSAGVPVLFQALDSPGLRYAATALYGTRACVKVATDCVERARQTEVGLRRAGRPAYVIVGGLGGTTMEGVAIDRADVPNLLYEIPVRDQEGGVGLPP